MRTLGIGKARTRPEVCSNDYVVSCMRRMMRRDCAGAQGYSNCGIKLPRVIQIPNLTTASSKNQRELNYRGRQIAI